MAFGKVTKEDLIEAGLNPDEIKTALAAVKDGSATKEDVTKISDALTAMKDTIAALETKLTAAPVKTTIGNSNGGDGNSGNNNGGNNNQRTPEEDMADYLSNPTDYIKRQSMGAYAASILESKKMTRSLAYKNALLTFSGMKNGAIKEEVDKEWEKYTPELFVRNNGDPEAVLQQVYDMVMGRHIEEISRDSAKKDGKYNLIHAGGSSGSIVSSSSSSGGGDNLPKMSEAEKKIAERFGMTEDEWLKQDKDMAEEELTRRRISVGAGV